MRAKALVLAIPLLVLLGTVTTVVALERSRTPDWREALSQYLAEQAASAQPFHVQHSVRARQPEQFRSEMADAVPSSQDWQWQIDRLPHPPDALYCVLLTRPAAPPGAVAPEPARRVVYVAHHSDSLWRVGWMVHQGPASPFPLDLGKALSVVGCKLDLNQTK